MAGERAFGLYILEDAHRLVGIAVLVAHEPSRRVGPDGDER
jgi:hypothetical protein